MKLLMAVTLILLCTSGASAYASASSSTTASTERSAWVPSYGVAGMSHSDIGVRDGVIANEDDYRHGFRYELGLGWDLSPTQLLEVRGFIPSVMQDEDRPEMSGFSAAWMLHFSERRFSPFVSAGLAYHALDAADSGLVLPESLTGIDLGLGVAYRFTPEWFGRLTVRRNEGFNDDLRLTHYQVSLGYRFGQSPKPAPVAVPVAPAPVAQPVPVAEPVVVVLPPDHDNDGVITAADECPNTPPGMPVNARGCSPFDLAISGVTFETNSARLTPVSQNILQRVAADLSDFPDQKIEIQAHTDDRGSAAYNQQLSQRRAESVRAFLALQGLNAGNLTAVGYGESTPKLSNDTVEGRAANRRVELKLIN